MSKVAATPRHDSRSVSRRARALAPFLAMEIFRKAVEMERAGQPVIHLEVGEPETPTPGAALEAGVRALRAGRTHYTDALGHIELREAICRWHAKHYGLEYSPENVVVTLGSSAAMLLVCAALLDPGSEVLISDPHYPPYPKFVTSFGGKPVLVPLLERDGFQPDPARLRHHLSARTRALILNSPANPTGAVLAGETMHQLCELARGRFTIISDEVYHGLSYGCSARSVGEFTDEAVLINGFSKLFAMTGWRLGYAIVPPFLQRAVQKLQQNLFISAPDFAQFAALVALEECEETVEDLRRSYDERRRLVLDRLSEMDLQVLSEPAGAFYVFVNVALFDSSSLRFATRLLEQEGVAVAPGIDFGPAGEGYIRISYASSPENLEEGMDRLERFLAREAPSQTDRSV